MAIGDLLTADVEVIDLRSSTNTPQPPSIPGDSNTAPPSENNSEDDDESNSEDEEDDEDTPSEEKITASRGATPMKVDSDEVKLEVNGDTSLPDAGDSAVGAGSNGKAASQPAAKTKSKAVHRSPSPPPPPPAAPRPTLRLDITLGGPDNYEVDITRLSIDTGQLPDIAVPVPVVVDAGSDGESEDEKEKEKGDKEKTDKDKDKDKEEDEKDGKTKKRGRKVIVLLYPCKSLR